jgi:hypothetical protein
MGCDVFLLPALAEMLGNPETKRVAWEHLRKGSSARA